MLLSLSFLTLASLSLNLPSVHRNVEEKKKKKKQQFNPTHQLIIFFVFKYIQFSNLSFFCHHRLDNFYSLLLFFPPPPLFSLSLFNKFPSDNWNAMSSVKTICIYETFKVSKWTQVNISLSDSTTTTTTTATAAITVGLC